MTRPGYGASDPPRNGFSVAAQADALVAFLDALGIERAVFAGNSSPTAYLTYLVAHRPDRVAGLVYLAGLLPLWLQDVRESDPAGAGRMLARAVPQTSQSQRQAIVEWRPEFLDGDRPPIDVPVLAFAARSGKIGYERSSEALAFVGSPLIADLIRDLIRDLPPSPLVDLLWRPFEDPAFRTQMLNGIDDPEARTFLLRFADDRALQEEVWQYQLEEVAPALAAGQERFRQAFGDDLRVARVDVSTIGGYEYRDAAELIEPHLRRFPAELRARVPSGSDHD